MRRLGALLGVLVAALIAASCGESVSSQGEPKPQADDYLAVDKKMSRSANEAAPNAEKAKTAREVSSSEPAVNEMSVFSRPRTEEDVLPSRLFYRLKRPSLR
jgi:hypothetical protein